LNPITNYMLRKKLKEHNLKWGNITFHEDIFPVCKCKNPGCDFLLVCIEKEVYQHMPETMKKSCPITERGKHLLRFFNNLQIQYQSLHLSLKKK